MSNSHEMIKCPLVAETSPLHFGQVVNDVESIPTVHQSYHSSGMLRLHCDHAADVSPTSLLPHQVCLNITTTWISLDPANNAARHEPPVNSSCTLMRNTTVFSHKQQDATKCKSHSVLLTFSLSSAIAEM